MTIAKIKIIIVNRHKGVSIAGNITPTVKMMPNPSKTKLGISASIVLLVR